MPEILTFILLGLMGGLGQVVRIAYGLKQAIDKGKEIDPKRVLVSLIYAFIGGALIGVWTNDYRTAFFSGLAASDIIEGILKAGKGRK